MATCSRNAESAVPETSPASAHPDDFTHFAPAKRKDSNEVADDISMVATNSFINGLMTIANGLFAVLNDHRQVIAMNDTFIKFLGIEDTEHVFGLRPGEVVKCIHACELPGGCGTSEYCSTCGAAVSIMAALETRKPQERTCAINVEKDNQRIDLYFNVRSCPLVMDDRVYVLMFLQDISMQQYRACLDRTFFHDINNILSALIGKSELLSLRDQAVDKKQNELHQIVLRIAQEIAIQNSLQKSLDASYKPLYSEVDANSILSEVENLFRDHPLTAQRALEVTYVSSPITFVTDFHLTSRIVINMVTNALEATPKGGTVRLFVDPHLNSISFCVWNPGAIPNKIAHRIFQRNFSTKDSMGRGFGTYSMKLFGEQVLGGMVRFDTSIANGTTFRFTHITQ